MNLPDPDRAPSADPAIPATDALRRDRDAAAEPPLPEAGPVDGDWAAREDAARGQAPAHEDGLLESLGKAVSDPLRSAADDSPQDPPAGA